MRVCVRVFLLLPGRWYLLVYGARAGWVVWSSDQWQKSGKEKKPTVVLVFRVSPRNRDAGPFLLLAFARNNCCTRLVFLSTYLSLFPPQDYNNMMSGDRVPHVSPLAGCWQTGLGARPFTVHPSPCYFTSLWFSVVLTRHGSGQYRVRRLIR